MSQLVVLTGSRFTVYCVCCNLPDLITLFWFYGSFIFRKPPCSVSKSLWVGFEGLSVRVNTPYLTFFLIRKY